MTNDLVSIDISCSEVSPFNFVKDVYKELYNRYLGRVLHNLPVLKNTDQRETLRGEGG